MNFNIDDWHKAAGKSHLCSEIVKNETKQNMKNINMKEEALKLASQLDGLNSCEPVIIKACEDMIRNLVEELNKQTKPLSDEEIAKIYHSENRFSPKGNFAYYGFARAIEERHGIK